MRESSLLSYQEPSLGEMRVEEPGEEYSYGCGLCPGGSSLQTIMTSALDGTRSLEPRGEDFFPQ